MFLMSAKGTKFKLLAFTPLIDVTFLTLAVPNYFPCISSTMYCAFVCLGYDLFFFIKVSLCDTFFLNSNTVAMYPNLLSNIQRRLQPQIYFVVRRKSDAVLDPGSSSNSGETYTPSVSMSFSSTDYT